MISLLLVLSIFVSSGVLWELRDTVITMVNEPLCGIEEHEHTDECYENRLICGLEENDEHTHTEECYEKVLICGHETHFHTLQCYTDEELPDNGEQSEDDENIVSIGLPDDESEVIELPVFKLDNEPVRLLAGEDDDQYNPQPIPTIDNIARGIKFTLFDYHDPNNELEAQQNNYDIPREPEPGQWVHNNIKYVGVNYDYERNQARDPGKDILFFAYGTPAFTGKVGTFYETGENAYKNYTRDWDTVNDRYNPSKNNYAGDYHKDVNGNTLSGNRPVQGIVQNQLVNGYPKVVGSDENSTLNYLFDEKYGFLSADYKTSYTDVNHFLQSVTDTKGSEHLVYNSNKNYAFFDTVSKNFTVYNGTYHIINDEHHRADDPIPGSQTNELYGSEAGYEMKIGFFPFDEYNIERRDPNFNGGNDFNHHFGLKMEADFYNVGTTEKPVIFKYSGDDDMWVFVDENLLLDIGGIHEPAEGLIDFTNGYIWVQDDIYGQSYSEIMETEGMNTELKKSELPDNFDEHNDHRWKVTAISEILGENWDNTVGHKHSIKMFYLERGGCYSNLSIDMTLPTVRPLSVTKTVDYGNHYSSDYDNNEYTFTIYEEGSNVPVDLGKVKNAAGEDVDANPFNLKNGERRDFMIADKTRKFYVVEGTVNSEIYSSVTVNGGAASAVDNGASSGNAVSLNSVDTYNFTNTVRQEMTDISVTKSWIEANGTISDGTGKAPIYFKIYQTDSVGSGDPKQVEINGVSTFALTSDNSWTWAPKDSNNQPIQLPSRYGEHIYTSSVQELNVPDGYEATYTKSGNNITIRNTAQTDQIWVEKQWIDATEADKKPVQLTLKRKKMSSSTSTQTSLKIRLLDPGGNELSSVTRTDVYVGGSVEFSLNVPGDVQYWKWDRSYGETNVEGEYKYYQLSEGLSLKELGSKRFEVSNLKQDTENTVDIKIIADNTDDSLLLLHHSFTRNTNGWEANGETPPEGYNYDNAKNNNQKTYAEILTSGGSAYAKGDGLLVRGRTGDWNGARLKLDPLKFKANHTYTFGVYVKYDNEEAYPATTEFVMTFNDGRESSTSYQRLLTQSVSKGSDWVQLVGTVTLPADINPYGMFLLIETNDIDGNDKNLDGPASFRMDEFTAIEGSKYVSVAENTGEVSIALKPYYYDEFGNEDFNGWSDFGGTSISTNQYNDDYYILIQNRDNVSDGISKPVPLLVPGKSYRFRAEVSGDDEVKSHLIGLSINKINLDADNAKCSNFKNITALSSPITGYGWGTLDTVYTIPSEADQNNMFLYFESPQDSGDLNDFRVWNFKVTDPDDFSVTKEGYTLSNPGINGVYVSNNNQYQIVVDTTSITSPRIYSDRYEEDTDFGSMIISLDSGNNGNNWKSYFLKSSLTGLQKEQDGYRYIYYVASETVNGATVDVDYIMLPIENDYVASNNESTPILVKNKNIKFKLPETGGGGTGRIYFFGGVLTAIGIISLSALYRRKRRRV